VSPVRATLVAILAPLLLATTTPPVAASAPASTPRVASEVLVSPRPVGDGRLSDRTFEPVVATHPADPRRIAVMSAQ
jgi:hypothetical protein